MSNNHIKILIATIFVSGFCALSYQMVWFREINLVFGVHLYSTTAVLTAFMAGLALGSYLFGLLVDRVKNPIKIYFLIEVGIGLYALLFPTLFQLMLKGYFSLNATYQPEASHLIMLRFVLSFLLLIIPTTLMAGTIPVISRIIIREIGKLGGRISTIYALNNLGAALGCLVAGFILIRTFGMRETLYVAATLNLINALVVLLLMRRGGWETYSAGVIEEQIMHPKPRYPVWYLRLILAVFALEGFTTLAYQVLWTRILLEFSYDKTVYLYAVIVSGFIFGLSIGGFIARRWVDRARDLASLLAIAQILIGVTSFALLILFVYLSPHLVQQRLTDGTWFSIAGKEYLIIFMMLLIPVTLMGFTFPLVSKIYTSSMRKLGSRLGVIGFLDTVGSIFGSFVAGFILIPVLGIYLSFVLIVMLNILLGASLIALSPNASKRKGVLVGGAILVVGLAFLLPSNQTYFQQRVRYFPNDRVLSYAEGASATVSVHQLPSRHKALAINGAKTAFTTDADIKVHTMLAHLPYLLAQEVNRAFVIGFGMGVTVNCLAEVEVPIIDVAELSAEVVSTSLEQFAYLNSSVRGNPSVNIHIEDGRSFLLKSSEPYDIITSNAVHARLGANLYTRDFYQICYDKISEHGIVCQWLPTNWLSDDEFRALVKSFHDVFPNTTLWHVTRGHMLLIGAKSDRRFPYEMMAQRFRNRPLMISMMGVDIRNISNLMAHLLADHDALTTYTKHASVNTDNYPFVEFSMVTDLKPNPKVLANVISLEAQFNDVFKFRDDEDTEYLMLDIKFQNDGFRDELRMYIRDLF